MAQKQNCWEFLKCGKELGGENITELSVCPAAIDTSANGLNGGINGGRICWAVTGTFCGDKVLGCFVKKHLNCRSCNFFKKVEKEEEAEFVLLKPWQKYTPLIFY